MKRVVVIQNVGDYEELELVFEADVMPMAIEFAERSAKRMNKKLVKSPKKIAELFPGCHRVACSPDEKVFYLVSKSTKKG